ncbi:retrovirus-related pol polyprotein from transposon TNT 1-94 [Tanacetum coccineum]
MIGNHSQLMKFVSKFLGTVRLKNDQVEKIMGYGDYQLGNVIISRVYYVEGIRHNLFSVGQFCDADLEVAFRKKTCYIRNLEGVDLLSGSKDTNLYTIFLMICKDFFELSYQKHQRLRDGYGPVVNAFKFGKSKKSSHQPKVEDTNQEKLYLLHMDLSMRVESINKKNIPGVPPLKTKYEAPAAIIKCIKNIQVHLKAIVRNVQTDNGTELVNQTLHEWYENVGITHQTSIARTPQQNDVVKSSGPGLQGMTPATSSTGLGSNPISQQPCLPPIRDDWDRFFQPMFDEYFNPSTINVSPVPEAAAPRAEVLADSLVSTSINQDAPSTKLPKTPTFHDDPLNESPREDSTYQGSSSNMRQLYTPFEHIGRWTKDHLIANVIGDPSLFVSTRKQLKTDAMLMPSLLQ